MPRIPRLVARLRQLVSPETLAPEHGAPLSQWLETFALPAIAIGLAWWAAPQDPLLIKATFPWLWLAPVLVALRYGVMPGLISSTLLLGNWVLADSLGRVPVEFLQNFFFGGGLLVLICGEFSDVWRDRILRMDETNIYITERLSRLTQRHLLLNLSHDRLEQEMLARPGSLRDALAKLRSAVIESTDDAALPGVEGLLQLLTQYVNVESATLYTINRSTKGWELGPAVGTLGEPIALTRDDPLLARALEQGRLIHIADYEVSLERQSRQLIVAPMVAGDKSIIGVLAVSRLPFFSLTVENLQMLSVILAYYADNVHGASDTLKLQQRLPTMPVMYAQEFSRMLSMQRRVRLSSQIVVMRFVGERREEIPAQFIRIKRGLDLYWKTYSGDNPILAILMPFASPAARDGFLIRIDGWMKAQFGGDCVELGVHLRSIDFATEDALEALAEALA